MTPQTIEFLLIAALVAIGGVVALEMMSVALPVVGAQ